jgi:hypothetical protein
MSLAGVIPRGPLTETVPRMVAMQAAVAMLLVAWAALRLRPVSRAMYDIARQTALRKVFRARWTPRPPCGDDPILWREIYGRRRASRFEKWVEHALGWCGHACLAYATWYFAAPAFAELFRNGYGPTSGAVELPPISPLLRGLVEMLAWLPLGLTPGLARVEFNVALRETSWFLTFVMLSVIAGSAAESVVAERERDTWLGVLATPLSGWEILRAKGLGAIWKGRGGLFWMLAIWTIGLLAGSVHPLGYVAATVSLAASGAFAAALGVSVSVRARTRSGSGGLVAAPVALLACVGGWPFLRPSAGACWIAAASPAFLAWVAPLSYEDIRLAARGSLTPGLSKVGLASPAELALVWLVGLTVQTVGALLVTRWAVRDFDAAVGRPVSSKRAWPGKLEGVGEAVETVRSRGPGKS